MGTPTAAEAVVSGLDETVAPTIDAVRLYGAFSASDVRRASTTTSQTPACAHGATRRRPGTVIAPLWREADAGELFATPT
jgi:hypothetical protein